MSYTFVTALYNINRERDGDGRKWDEYLAWFKNTLQIRAPLVVFIPGYLKDFVDANRNPEFMDKTLVVIQELDNIPYAYLHENIEHIIKSDAYRAKICDPGRIECNLPFYTIIQYSKFDWLRYVADMNPFQTVNFFWIDAGVSRFADINKSRMPGTIDIPSGKMIIQCNEYLSQYCMKDYLWSNQCLMCGTMFGGDKIAINSVGLHVQAFLNEHVLKNNWINNEQILLAYFAMVERKDFFHFMPNHTNQHLPLFGLLFG